MIIPSIVIAIIGIISIIILVVDDEQDDKIFILIPISAIIVLAVLSIILSDKYKQGQVDAITGKIKYELITNEDSTKTWEEIKQDK